VDVDLNVRQLAISSDSSKVYVARFITPRLAGEETATPDVNSGGGEILVVNAASLSINKTIGLRHSDKPDIESAGRGLPNYLGALAISPDGITGWTPSKQDNLLRGTLRDGNNLNFNNTVRAISSQINLTTDSENYPARLDHDNAGVASTALFNHSGNYLFVALETNREVAVVDSYGQRELFRIAVGRAPQGLALSPDGLRLYVHNFMDRSVTVLNISQLVNEGKNVAPPVATYNAVATEKLTAQVLAGKQFFYDAKDTRLARDSYISCASCHNDGGQDGRVWDLTGFGEGLRNTINLQGRAGLGQGFLHWSSNFDEVQDFEGQIRSLAGGAGLMSDAQFNSGTRSQPLGDAKTGVSSELDALAAYVTSLTTFANSPYRNSDGTLSADGNAGKTVFQNKNCAQCHSGANFTESGANILRNVGTIKPSSGSRLGGALTGIDTPTLRDVWATAPYLHDGSAATLAAAVRAHNNVAVADNAVAQLVAYLQQIDGSEPAPFNSPPTVNLTAPANGATFTQGTAINLTADATDNSGTVSKVEFYAGTTLLNTDTAAPFAFSWTNAAAGSYALTAKAYDSLNASATSAVVNITVNAAGGSGAGLTAHYFTNLLLDGNPALQRTEAVNFDWVATSPGTGVGADNFSVRWLGQVEAPSTGAYQFQTISDDGVRLWLNGVLTVDNWTDHSTTTNTGGNISLTANTKYHIRVEFYERGGNAVAKLLWKLPGATTFVPVPADRLYVVTNVAQGKTSSQSSTANSGAAARAIDGKTNGAYNNNSVTHTNYSTNAWWQVNLGASYAINSITLWNRTDCCANRLSNFYVFVSANDITGRSYSSLLNDSSVWRYQVTGQAPTKLHIPANVNGRYVRVQLAGANYLSLAEVQVWAR
jgi:cytochrome c peroxidase